MVIQPEQTAVLAAVQAQCRISGFYLDADLGNLRSLYVDLQGESGLLMIAASRGRWRREGPRRNGESRHWPRSTELIKDSVSKLETSGDERHSRTDEAGWCQLFWTRWLKSEHKREVAPLVVVVVDATGFLVRMSRCPTTDSQQWRRRHQ